MKKNQYRISLIGPGKVGLALCSVLVRQKHQVVATIGHETTHKQSSGTQRRAGKFSTILSEVPKTTNVILIATPGTAVAEIATSISTNRSIPWKEVLVIHTSGGDGAELLAPLAKLGAKTAAVHPIQTFPKLLAPEDAAMALHGVTYGYDAPKNSLVAARSFIRELGGKPFHVPAPSRPLYHAMCVFASGYAVQVLQTIEELRKQLPGDMPWQDIIGTLFLQSVTNAFNESPVAATTGPIVRGDVATVRSHIKALSKKTPAALAAYRALGLLSVDNLSRAKELDKKTATSLRSALNSKPKRR